MQARLRTEVHQARSALTANGADWHQTCLPYDTLIGLPFLDAVVRETLRLHPPTNMMNRVYVPISSNRNSRTRHRYAS